MRQIPPYSYIKHYYKVDPKIGQRIRHHVTKGEGVILKPKGDPQYLLVRFDKGHEGNVHPTECDYL